MKIVSVALAIGVISGCGQKGPLYLPPKNGTVVTRPATSTPPQQQPNAPAKPDKKDDNNTSQPK